MDSWRQIWNFNKQMDLFISYFKILFLACNDDFNLFFLFPFCNKKLII